MKTVNRNRQRPEGQRARRNEEESIRQQVQSGMRPDRFPDSNMSKEQRADQEKMQRNDEQTIN